jgi:subtilisin-like proprotein convertase family protein
MLAAVAPSSGAVYAITTTDLKGSRGTSTTDCTSSFGGTSAAAPLVAGVVALILQANPNLGWRDVQGVIIQSATKNDESDSDWVQNGAGLWVNHKYGFGLVNAYQAVTVARTWNNLGPVLSTHSQVSDNSAIPEGSWLSVSIFVNERFTVEHVELLFQASHRQRGDLRVELVSPSGTVSTLAEAHRDTNADYNWTFGSIRHWGEASQGSWTLRVKDDTINSITGSMIGARLAVYGH